MVTILLGRTDPFMEETKGQDNLGGVEATGIIAETAGLTKLREELAANDVLHHHIEALAVLEGAEEIHYKGMVGDAEDLLLRLDVVDLLRRRAQQRPYKGLWELLPVLV